MTVACSQCGQAPEHRVDPEKGLHMLICQGCLYHGGAHKSERYAFAAWGLVNDDDLSRHRCAQASPPRFFQRSRAWGCRCGCGLEVSGIATIEGARASWESAVRE